MILKVLPPLYFVAVHSSLGPAYLIELLHTCERLHRGIGSFP